MVVLVNAQYDFVISTNKQNILVVNFDIVLQQELYSIVSVIMYLLY